MFIRHSIEEHLGIPPSTLFRGHMHPLLSITDATAGLAEITEQVFETMAGIIVNRVDEDHSMIANPVGAVLCYDECAAGMILVECDYDLAISFTERFMPGANPRSIDTDVRDSMGELANMIGGNLKCLLPVETSLSMPTVLCGAELRAFKTSARMKGRLEFESDGRSCCVSLLDQR